MTIFFIWLFEFRIWHSWICKILLRLLKSILAWKISMFREVFYTFQHTWKVFMTLVPFTRALTNINILGLPCNLYKLMFVNACLIIKLKCLPFIVHLLGYSKVFRALLKWFAMYFNSVTKIKHSEIYILFFFILENVSLEYVMRTLTVCVQGNSKVFCYFIIN